MKAKMTTNPRVSVHQCIPWVSAHFLNVSEPTSSGRWPQTKLSKYGYFPYKDLNVMWTSELLRKIFHINKPATWVAIAEVHVQPTDALGLQYTRPPFRVHRTTSFKHCLLFVALLPAASFCLDHTKTSNHPWIPPLSARRVVSQADTSSVPRRMCNGPQGHVVLR